MPSSVCIDTNCPLLQSCMSKCCIIWIISLHFQIFQDNIHVAWVTFYQSPVWLIMQILKLATGTNTVDVIMEIYSWTNSLNSWGLSVITGLSLCQGVHYLPGSHRRVCEWPLENDLGTECPGHRHGYQMPRRRVHQKGKGTSCNLAAVYEIFVLYSTSVLIGSCI